MDASAGRADGRVLTARLGLRDHWPPVTSPQNLASARGSAQSNVMLRTMEFMAFSALQRAPAAWRQRVPEGAEITAGL